MKVAIMQPYFLPYLGYFQLIHAVDSFVVYDNVNYIKGGWINRNYMLGQEGKQWINLSLQALSPNKLINQINLTGDVKKLLKSIRQNYVKAPCFDTVFPLVKGMLLSKERNLARFLDAGLRKVCIYLGLRPSWHVASDLDIVSNLYGQDRVLSICQLLGADHYINLPGGRGLYDSDSFAERGIKLSFIEPMAVRYHQFGMDFVPDLSILDVMMFNEEERCHRLLQEYRIV